MTQMDVLLIVMNTLNQTGIPYMLTGAYAVSFYGRPRTTHDIDLKILINDTEIEKIYDAFKESFYINKEMIRQAVRRNLMFNIIHNETQTKIDFWVVRNDEFDQERFKRRLKINIYNAPVFMSTPEDLIVIKLCWYRESNSQKHYEDVKGIFEIQSDKLDIEYITKWAKHFSVLDILEDILKK